MHVARDREACCAIDDEAEHVEESTAAATAWDCYAPQPGHPTPDEKAAFIRRAGLAALKCGPPSAILAMEGGYGYTRTGLYANNRRVEARRPRRLGELQGRDRSLSHHRGERVDRWLADEGYNYDPPVYKRTIKNAIASHYIYRFSASAIPGGRRSHPPRSGLDGSRTKSGWLHLDRVIESGVFKVLEIRRNVPSSSWP